VGQTKSYTEQHPLFDGEAMLYRAPASGDVWQFRTWIAAEKKYVRKTLKTRDLVTAIERGKKLFFDLQHAVLSGKKIFGLTARELVDQFLVYQQERVDADRITQGRFSTIKTQLTRHFLGFLAKVIHAKEKWSGQENLNEVHFLTLHCIDAKITIVFVM
jgi:hypothetical protein